MAVVTETSNKVELYEAYEESELIPKYSDSFKKNKSNNEDCIWANSPSFIKKLTDS